VNAGPSTHTLFLVPSANHAVQGEAALLREGIRCRLIPVPRDLSSQCGVCLSVRLADRSAAATVLRAAGTVTEGIHDVRLPSAGEAGDATARGGSAAGEESTAGRPAGLEPPSAE